VSQSPPPPPPPPGYSSYGQRPVRQTSSDAIVALVLSILSWVVCPLVLAIVALVFAGKASRAIAASGGWLEGWGMVTAARIIAWINIILSALATALFIIVLAGAAGTGY
jgi:hypothetical protein